MFYTFTRNNSGGCFIINKEKGVCEHLIIEADSFEEALEKFDIIRRETDGFDYYRWHYDDEPGQSEPCINVKDVNTSLPLTRVFIHYKSGKIKQVVLKD